MIRAAPPGESGCSSSPISRTPERRNLARSSSKVRAAAGVAKTAAARRARWSSTAQWHGPPPISHAVEHHRLRRAGGGADPLASTTTVGDGMTSLQLFSSARVAVEEQNVLRAGADVDRENSHNFEL